MTNDLYVWEGTGATVHHCPQCQNPLTTPQARTRCLGEHVEWCKRYHTQLFKKGTSSKCLPCHMAEGEHTKRHREIAITITELKMLKAAVEKAGGKVKSPTGGKKGKKKHVILQIAVTQVQIEHVARILHPEEFVEVEVPEGGKEEMDEEIFQHLFFNKATSSVRETRNQFLEKAHNAHRRRSSAAREGYHPEKEQIDGLLQLLDISPATKHTPSDQKSLINTLRTKIEEDLIQVHNETNGIRQRKGGFWRWASKKVYKKFMKNGGFWGKSEKQVETALEAVEEEGDLTTEDEEWSKEDAVGGAELEAELSEEGEGEGQYTFSTADNTAADPASSAVVAPTDLSAPRTPSTLATADDTAGWSTVAAKKGAKASPAAPGFTLKLVSNGGLAKLL
ncbi:uncharacterized protein LTR77_009300 [Saxophila tyrrhenica]|uniref:Uncharacterized protein n=1 Tax=Saxophila tyrrhenica TaxID=1690608 RepID=A0AAV9P230_9PEZI|nr:hypothetical protein LTR77_009300 [Saxophila tyrrhenica]